MLENCLSIVESMSSEYTKFLLIIFVMLVLSGGLWLLESLASDKTQETFISDDTVNSQIKFINARMDKAIIGDGAIDVPRLPYPDDLKRATEDIDIFAKRQRPHTENWYTDVMNSPIWQAELKCRKTEKPQDLPDDNIKQRIDCSWMFNPNGPSGATLCSLAGPVFSSSRTLFSSKEYEFLWSKNTAVKKEALKACALVKACDLVTPGSGCGFCPNFGYAVPVDGAGNSLYPEAKCASKPVINPTNCSKPVAQGGAGMPESVCQPDSQGRLSKNCLVNIAGMANLTDKGTIVQALRDSANPNTGSSQTNTAAGVMQMYNFSIPNGLLSDGSVTVNAALDTYNRISKASQSSSVPRVQKAAANLATGASFDICDYDNSSTEEFALKCLQNLYLNAGCQGRGSEFPTNDNIKDFYGKKWGDIKQNVNLLVAQMTNPTRAYTIDQQKIAIQRCIGTHLRQESISYCNELGVSVLMYLTNGYDKYRYYGRKILTNQFFMLRSDSTLWNSLGVLNSAISQGWTVQLYVLTNINPTAAATLNYTRVGNTTDVIMWNDKELVNKSGNGISQNPVNGLVVVPNQQQNQRLLVDIIIPPEQVTQQSTTWYMTDSANNPLSIDVCRLPIERKNPVMNITMNQGIITEINGNFNIQTFNTTSGNRGGRSCTVFNGVNSYVKINTHLRNKAFRSYTLKFYSESLGNCTRLWQLYNGGYSAGYVWSWWGWQWNWRYDAENYGVSTDALDIVFGYQDTSLCTQYKTPGYPNGNMSTCVGNGVKLNQWQHLTFIWNDDFSGHTMYLEGVQVASAKGTPIAEAFTQENYIGKGYFDGWTGMFKGGMEWFRAFDYPLTPAEMKQDMEDDW